MDAQTPPSSKLDPKQHPSYQTLTRIVEIMERKFGAFPRGACIATSAVVEAILGYPIVHGEYWLLRDDVPANKAVFDHAWNEDRTAMVEIDLTQYQFSLQASIYIPKVVIAPIGSLPELVRKKSQRPIDKQQYYDLVRRVEAKLK